MGGATQSVACHTQARSALGARQALQPPAAPPPHTFCTTTSTLSLMRSAGEASYSVLPSTTGRPAAAQPAKPSCKQQQQRAGRSGAGACVPAPLPSCTRHGAGSKAVGRPPRPSLPLHGATLWRTATQAPLPSSPPHLHDVRLEHALLAQRARQVPRITAPLLVHDHDLAQGRLDLRGARRAGRQAARVGAAWAWPRGAWVQRSRDWSTHTRAPCLCPLPVQGQP